MSLSRTKMLYIKPGSLSTRYAELLFEYISTDPSLSSGSVLAAGEHSFVSCWESDEVKFHLANDVICAGELDPSNVTESNVDTLKLFMQSKYAGKYFHAGKHMLSLTDEVSGKVSYYYLSLKHAVGVRKNDYGKIVCDVYDQKVLGKGSYGEVKDIIGSLKYRYHKTRELVFEPSGGRRVVKELRRGLKDDVKFNQDITRETSLLKIAAHTHARSALSGNTVDDEPVYAISMSKFPGFVMSDLIFDDDQMQHFKREGVRKSVANTWLSTCSKTMMAALTIDDRFQITIELLKQLRRQVHDRGLIHRDIKLENIMISKENGVWRVNIIDFNLSRTADHDDKRCCGSPHYVPKEVSTAELDESSDLFSMGLVIAMLWRDTEQKDLLALNARGAFKSRCATNWNIDLNMFEGLDELPGQIKLSLSLLLTYILADKKSRPSVKKSLAQFEDIYTNYRLSLLPLAEQQSLCEGYKMAKTAQKKLDKLACETVNHLSVCKLRDDLLNIIDRVADDQHTIQAFIQAVDVKCFEGLQMKDQLKIRIKEVTDNFLQTYQQTEKLLSQLREIYAAIGAQGSMSDELRQRVTVLSEQIHEVAAFAEKIAKTPLDIDSIAFQTQHLQKKNGKIERAMMYFDQLQQPSREPLSRAASIVGI